MMFERVSVAFRWVWAGLIAVGLGAVGEEAVADEATPIVFAAGPDGSGTLEKLIARFNSEHAGRFRVTWQKMDRDNNTHYRQLTEGFTKQAAPHVMAADVIWTAEFARKGWVQDLTSHLYDAYDRKKFVRSALDSATHRLRIWGVPWYIDAGVLFYRKDLLAKSGFDAPPETWDELSQVAQKVMKDSKTEYGFVFQGAAYEGGSANAAEYIWGAGGHIMQGNLTVVSPLSPKVVETDAVRIKSKEAAAGLDLARRLIVEGVAPLTVSTYREKEALDAFVGGKAVFLRSWPYVQRMFGKGALSDDQVGVTLLPAVSGEGRGYSCLGGFSLMVNAQATPSQRTAALAFIRYLTAPKQQKEQALNAGLLPVWTSLYQDPEISSQVPIAALFRDTISSRLRVRPKSPYYVQMSASLADAFHRVLKGELTGEQAVQSLDKNLRGIVARNL